MLSKKRWFYDIDFAAARAFVFLSRFFHATTLNEANNRVNRRISCSVYIDYKHRTTASLLLERNEPAVPTRPSQRSAGAMAPSPATRKLARAPDVKGTLAPQTAYVRLPAPRSRSHQLGTLLLVQSGRRGVTRYDGSNSFPLGEAPASLLFYILKQTVDHPMCLVPTHTVPKTYHHPTFTEVVKHPQEGNHGGCSCGYDLRYADSLLTGQWL